MFGKFTQIWSDIKNGLWFIPTVMGIGATILAFLLIELDTNRYPLVRCGTVYYW